MSCTRRDLLKLANAIALAAAIPSRAAAATPPAFEISASLYAWDLHDEGIEQILDNLQGMAGVNSIYLVGLMHKARLPFTGAVFPHNLVRKTWEAEDARAYWHPQANRYARIAPRLSDFAWLNRTDWLKAMIEPVRRRGLKVGVEISHTVLAGERAMGQFSDCMQRDIHGKPLILWDGVAYPVCLNNRDVREYLLGLFTDLTANYDLDYIQTCLILFAPGGPATGGCFCASCARAASETGFDLERANRVLLANPTAKDETDHWQAFRRDSVTRFYETLHHRIHSTRPKADFRFNSFVFQAETWGADLSAMKPHLDSIRVMEYSEQKGDATALEFKRRWLTQVRQSMGKDFPILSAIAVRPKATPELIQHGIRIALECGVNGITLGHYEGADFPMLRAVRTGLRAVQVEM